MLGHPDAEGVELLGVPAGADAHDHPIAAEQAGELREVADDQGRMGEPDVGDEAAEVEPIRDRADRGEDHEGVVRPEGGRAVTARGDEEVVGEEHAVDAEVVEASDPRPQPGEVATGPSATQRSIDTPRCRERAASAVTETVANGWSEWSASPFVAEIDSTVWLRCGLVDAAASPVASAG